jgi:hypothetical protein
MDGQVMGAGPRPAAAVGVGVAILVVAVSGCASFGAAIAEAERLPPQISVRVVNAAGAPIAGARVEGQISSPPGRAASATTTSLGYGITGTDGTTVLVGLKDTARPIDITAKFRDWPVQTLRFAGDAPEAQGSRQVVVVLSPAAP